MMANHHPPGSADLEVLGYLGRALSLEYSAVQMYSTQSRLVASWGLNTEADKFQAEAREEMGHADRIIARMLAKGFAPAASQLRPVKLGPDLLSLLKIDQAFEDELVKLYHDAVVHCASHQQHDDRIFFQGLLDEEKQHSSDLAAWIQALSTAPASRGR